MRFAGFRFGKVLVSLMLGMAAVTASVAITQSASAAPATTYTLTYKAGANGTLSGKASQSVTKGNSGSKVTAVPNTGYEFVSWSDGVKTAARTESGVKGNISVTASFAVQTFKLNYSVSGKGSLTGKASQTVNYNSAGATVTAVPATGYVFVKWSDGVKTAARTDSKVKGDISVSATFAIKVFKVAYVAGKNGTISGDLDQEVNYGDDASAVTAIPAPGYKFVDWSDDVTTAKRTDKDVDGNLTVTANFEIETYKLTYAVSGKGTITGTASQTVQYKGNGTKVTAVPAAGYSFVKWSDGVKTPARTDLARTSSLSVTAQFAIQTFSLKYAAGANGSISGTANQTVDYLQDGVRVTAVPAKGYKFVKWSDELKTAARTDLDRTSNIEVTAIFEAQKFVIRYQAGDGGTITGTAQQTVAYLNSASAVTATPNTGFRFVQWSDGIKTATRTDNDVDADVSVTATFQAITYSLKYSAGTNGSITGNTNQTVGYLGDGATVTAVPATGYKFVQWSDGNKNAARTDLDRTSDLTVSASFTIQTFTVSFTAGSNGSITGSATQTVNYNASATTVTAVPATGYRFVQWSDGIKDASRTPTNVKADLSVTATFAIQTFTLTYGVESNGSITGATPQTVNYNNSGTQVTAVPAAGYRFSQWSDGKTTISRVDATVKANLSVRAIFVIQNFTVTYIAGPNGSITGTLTQSVDYNGSTTSVTAVPAPGYEFEKWSDNKTTVSRSETTVRASKSVTASFKMTAAEIAAQAAAEEAVAAYEAGQIQLLQAAGEAANAVQVVATRSAFFARIHARTEVLATENVSTYENGTIDNLLNAQLAVSALPSGDVRTALQGQIDARSIIVVGDLVTAFEGVYPQSDDQSAGTAAKAAIVLVANDNMLGDVVTRYNTQADNVAENMTARYESGDVYLDYNLLQQAIELSNNTELKPVWIDRVAVLRFGLLFNDCKSVNCTDGSALYAEIDKMTINTDYATQVRADVDAYIIRQTAINMTLDYAYARTSDLAAVYAAIAKVPAEDPAINEMYGWIMNRFWELYPSALAEYDNGLTDSTRIREFAQMYRDNPVHDPNTADLMDDHIIVIEVSRSFNLWQDGANDSIVYDPQPVMAMVDGIKADLAQKAAIPYYVQRIITERLARWINSYVYGEISDPTKIYDQAALIPEQWYVDLGGDKAQTLDAVTIRTAELAVAAFEANPTGSQDDALAKVALVLNAEAKQNFYDRMLRAYVPSVLNAMEPNSMFDPAALIELVQSSSASDNAKGQMIGNIGNATYDHANAMLSDYINGVTLNTDAVFAQIALIPATVDQNAVANIIYETHRALLDRLFNAFNSDPLNVDVAPIWAAVDAFPDQTGWPSDVRNAVTNTLSVLAQQAVDAYEQGQVATADAAWLAIGRLPAWFDQGTLIWLTNRTQVRTAELAVTAFNSGAVTSDVEALAAVALVTDEAVRADFYTRISRHQIELINSLAVPGSFFSFAQQLDLINASLTTDSGKAQLRSEQLSIATAWAYGLVDSYKLGLNGDDVVWQQLDSLALLFPELDTDAVAYLHTDLANRILDFEFNRFVNGEGADGNAVYAALANYSDLTGWPTNVLHDVNNVIAQRGELAVQGYENGSITDREAVLALIDSLSDIYFADAKRLWPDRLNVHDADVLVTALENGTSTDFMAAENAIALVADTWASQALTARYMTVWNLYNA